MSQQLTFLEFRRKIHPCRVPPDSAGFRRTLLNRCAPEMNRAWLQTAHQLRDALVKRACEGRNRIEPGLRASAFHFDNGVFGKAAMDGEIGEAPTARLAEPFHALAEPDLKGLGLCRHPYRFSGTERNRDSSTLVRILLFWYDEQFTSYIRLLPEPVCGRSIRHNSGKKA